MEFFLENPLSCFREAFPRRRVDDDDDHHEEALCWLFQMEKDHMPCGDYVTSLKNGDFDVSIRSRRDAISSISQLSSEFEFDPMLQYLAVNYLDRFLFSQGLGSVKPPWASRLLAVSCLSLAAKLLEAEMPISIIQGNGDSRTVRRMEALILGTLGWRMRSATPFSFVSFFVSLFKIKDPPFRQLLRERAAEIILKTQKDVELLGFKPSIVAASALLSASHELFPVQFQCFMTAVKACSYVNKEELTECYGAMQGVVTDRFDLDSVILDADGNVSSGEDTPMNVLDQQFSCSRSTSISNSCCDTSICMEMSSSSSSSTPSTHRPLKRGNIFL